MPRTIEQWRAIRQMESELATHARVATVPVVVRDTEHGGFKTLQIKYVPELPVSLAQQAGCSVEAYSLARCMASEGHTGTDYTLAMMLIGHVIIRVGTMRYPQAAYPMTTLLTYSAYQAVRWRYGEQSGRWAATTRDPTKWHVMLAQALLAGEVPDMTRGATKFLAPWAPGAKQNGKPLRPFAQVMKKWHEEVAWTGSIPGIEDMRLAFFRPEKDVHQREAAYNAIMGLWRAKFGGMRESESEGH